MLVVIVNSIFCNNINSFVIYQMQQLIKVLTDSTLHGPFGTAELHVHHY